MTTGICYSSKGEKVITIHMHKSDVMAQPVSHRVSTPVSVNNNNSSSSSVIILTTIIIIATAAQHQINSPLAGEVVRSEHANDDRRLQLADEPQLCNHANHNNQLSTLRSPQFSHKFQNFLIFQITMKHWNRRYVSEALVYRFLQTVSLIQTVSTACWKFCDQLFSITTFLLSQCFN